MRMTYDQVQRFNEMAHYYMSKCEYRVNANGTAVCSLHVLPCEKVFKKGKCEAVAREWNKGGEEE